MSESTTMAAAPEAEAARGPEPAPETEAARGPETAPEAEAARRPETAPETDPISRARKMRADAARRYVQRQTEQWEAEAAELKASCPGFTLEAALAEPEFCAMLRAGVPLRRAYFALHAEEALHAAAALAGRQAEQRVADHIRARGARPGENGLGPGGGILIRPDVSRMSRADRADVARRAARGEQVKLGV